MNNPITNIIQADDLIKLALREDISQEDVISLAFSMI